MIRYKYALGFCLWLAFIAYLSLTPDTPVSSPVPGMDKVIHLVFYLVLTWLLGKSLKKEIGVVGAIFWTLLIAIPVCVGISIELIQSTVPGREREWMDIVFNVIGTMIIVVVFVKSDQ